MRALGIAALLVLLHVAGCNSDCSHASIECGACESGFVADDVCDDDKYICRCKPADMSGVVPDFSLAPDLSSHD
jgi:hypothetical protein